jgi:dihydrofolate reductase
MQRVTYFIASTLDGFIARRDGRFDFFLDAPEVAQRYLDSLRGFDVALMGRSTWEVGRSAGVTNPYPWLKTYVFSRTTHQLPDSALTLVRDEATGVVAKLKATPGRGIYLCGGGQLASHLFDANLIDEVRVKLHPLLLGDGLPLAPALKRLVQLAPTSAPRVDGSGVIELQYRLTQSDPFQA